MKQTVDYETQSRPGESSVQSPTDKPARLVDRFGMNRENIEWRQRMLHFDDEDCHVMEELIPWAQSVAPSLVKDYFETMFSFAPLMANYERWARDEGIAIEELRTRLERLRAGYYVSLFEGARHRWDVDHLEAVLKLGLGFRESNVAPKFYLSFWNEFGRQSRLYLAKTITDRDRRDRAADAIGKVLSFHSQLINDAFLMATLENMGLDVLAVDRKPAEDPTENLDQISRAIRLLIRQAGALAEDRLRDPILDQGVAVAGSFGQSFDKLRHSLLKFAKYADLLSQGDLNNTELRMTGTEGVLGQSMNRLLEGEQQLGSVLSLLAVGDCSTTVELRSDRDVLMEANEELVNTLKRMLADTQALARSTSEKDLRCRADESKHRGDYRKIIGDINRTIDAVVVPLRMSAEGAVAVATAADEFTATSREMQAAAEEAARQAEGLMRSSAEVADNIENVAASTALMETSILEISRNANQATRIAGSAVTAAGSTNKIMEALRAASEEIGNVVKVISTIARQTNLLALNATIEAARAGEAGKGFAVVANEVKELAKGTSEATEEITRNVESIQEETRAVLKTIADVTDIIQQIHGLSTSIADAVEQQTVTTNDIGRHVTEAAKGASVIARTTRTVAEAAKTTLSGAGDVQNAALSLAQLAANLENALQAYRM